MATWPLLACLIVISLAVGSTAIIYMGKYCNKTINVYYECGGSFKLSLMNSDTPNECEVELKAQTGHHLMFKFISLQLGDCAAAVTLYGHNTDLSNQLVKLTCTDSDVPKDIYSTPSHTAVLRFESGNNPMTGNDFKVLVTTFRVPTLDEGGCLPTELECTHKRCIDNALKCNGIDYCGDGNVCSDDNKPEEHATPLFVLTGVGIFGTLAALVSSFLKIKKKSGQQPQSMTVNSEVNPSERMQFQSPNTSQHQQPPSSSPPPPKHPHQQFQFPHPNVQIHDQLQQMALRAQRDQTMQLEDISY